MAGKREPVYVKVLELVFRGGGGAERERERECVCVWMGGYVVITQKTLPRLT